MLHQVLGLEVRTAFVLRAGGMHHREGALLVELVHLVQRRMEGEQLVEPQGLGGRNGEMGAGPVVAVIADRRYQAQAIGASAQEHHHQGAINVLASAEYGIGHLSLPLGSRAPAGTAQGPGGRSRRSRGDSP